MGVYSPANKPIENPAQLQRDFFVSSEQTALEEGPKHQYHRQRHHHETHLVHYRCGPAEVSD